MNAIILAAGMGRRLAQMGWDKPKCLLPIGGTTLLGNTLGALCARGIQKAVIVVGYRRELVEREAARHNIACTFIENPDFACTNTIYSLFLAREHLDNGFLYFNADVWFQPGALDLLTSVSNSADAALLIDERRCGAEEVKIVADDTGKVTQLGKELDPELCDGEFIGIARFNRSICPALVGSLERRCADSADRNMFFEASVSDLLTAYAVTTVPLGDERAVEIDIPEDYARARDENGKSRK